MPTLYYIKDQRAPPQSWRLELEHYYIKLSLFIGGWGSPGQGVSPHPSHAKSPCPTAPGGICPQPSKIFKQGLSMCLLYLLFIHYFSHNKGTLAILVIELGPLWLSLHVTLGVLINITLCRLLGQAVMSTMCLFVLSLWWNQVQKIKSKQCIVSSNNNAKTIVLRAWNNDTARAKVFVASCWMSSSCTWMFSMKYEKIVERFHKSKIAYNLCLHLLWFVFALPVSAAVAIVISY